MIRCPNCGSTAQPKIIDSEHYIWQGEVSVIIAYKCGCGRMFATREVFKRENEEIFDENI